MSVKRSSVGQVVHSDLLCLDIDALVIPTPGQTEQVYLAEQMLGKLHYAAPKGFKLPRACKSISSYGSIEYLVFDL